MYMVYITGVGYSLCYITTSVVIQSHFDENRALAAGCAMMGCSIGNLIAPSLITYLIEIYGWRGSMLIMAAILAHIITFGALIKTPPRLGNNSNPVHDDEVGQDGNLYKPDERVTVTTVQQVSAVAAPDALTPDVHMADATLDDNDAFPYVKCPGVAVLTGKCLAHKDSDKQYATVNGNHRREHNKADMAEHTENTLHDGAGIEKGRDEKNSDTAMSQSEDTAMPQSEDTTMPQSDHTSITQSEDTAMPQSDDAIMTHSEDTKVTNFEDSKMTNSVDTEMPHSEDISLIHSEESEQDNCTCKEITRSDDTKMTYSDVRELPYSELVLSLATDRTQGEDTQKTQSEVTVGVSYEWKDTAVIVNDTSDIACVRSNGTYVGFNGSYVSGTVTTKVTEPTRGNIVGAKSFLNDVFDFGLLKNYVFLLVCICSMMSLYNQETYVQHMPSKAVVLGHSKDEAAFLVSVFCTAAVTSRIVVTLVANTRCVNRTMMYACGIMLGGVAAYLTLLHGMVGLSVASVTYGVHMG